MFATEINCTVGTNKPSFFFNRTNIIHYPLSQAPSIRFPSYITMNSGYCSPSANIYVPNLPIQTSRYSTIGRSANIGTYYPFHSTNNTSAYSSYYGHWNFGNHNGNAHFLSQTRPLLRNGKFTELSTYGNSTYFVNDRSHNMGFSTISYNNYNSNSAYQHRHHAGNPFYGNFPMNYAQINPIPYQLYPGNAYQLPSSHQSIIPSSSGQRSAFALCKNQDLRISQPTETEGVASTSTLVTPPKPIENETDSSSQKDEPIPQQEMKPAFGGLVKSNDEVTGKNKRGQKKNVMLVSLPGGQPLFSVPLKPSATGKKRGRPPKPKPSEESQPPSETFRNTKLRYKRGKSHLKLLQSAPNLKPCVSTLETFQRIMNKSNSNKDLFSSCTTSFTSKPDATDTEVQIIGYFPPGTTHLKANTSYHKNELASLSTPVIPQASCKVADECLTSRKSNTFDVNIVDQVIARRDKTQTPTHITNSVPHYAPILEKKELAIKRPRAGKKVTQSRSNQANANDMKKVAENPTLESQNSTLALAFKARQLQCLDMPNIFENLGTPNEKCQVNDENQNDSMSDTEHDELACLQKKDEASLAMKSSIRGRQPQQPSKSGLEDTNTSYSAYVQSFLSDDESDADFDPKRMEKSGSLENLSKDNSIVSNDSRGSHSTISCVLETVDTLNSFQTSSKITSGYCNQIEEEALESDETDEGPTFQNTSSGHIAKNHKGTLGINLTNGYAITATKMKPSTCNVSSKMDDDDPSSPFLSLWQHFIDFKENESGARHEEIHKSKVPINNAQHALQTTQEAKNEEHASAFAELHTKGANTKKPGEKRHATKYLLGKGEKFASVGDNNNLAQCLATPGSDTDIESFPGLVGPSSGIEIEIHSPITSPELDGSFHSHDLQPTSLEQNASKNHDESFRNKKIKRMSHCTQVSEEFVPKRQKQLVDTFDDKSQGLDLTKSQENKEAMKSQGKSRCRTNSMIRNLIKYTKSQSFKTGNETKSKLNADLNKVFLLGSNPPKRKSAGVEKLKEVLLEIPGPMERRAKLRYSMKEKAKSVPVQVMQNEDVHKDKETGEQVFCRYNQEPPPHGSNTIKLSDSEDEENAQNDLGSSKTNRPLECFETKGKTFQNETNDFEEMTYHSITLPNENYDFEDDDRDILDIHAERDSLLDMFD